MARRTTCPRCERDEQYGCGCSAAEVLEVVIDPRDADGWRYDIENAPKGTTKTVDGPKGPREVHVPEPVFLACRDGQTVTLSRWMPKEGRWNMLATGEQPVAWWPFPKHPSAGGI